ncbi:unnamed protein product [Tuwongella immobilis]|uniref:Uncharacterized protein n=1 Tax=Tuwongella immobilis TaxID=692036 RepID=A0A6C2YKX6_9BACT|nr:unnamed protein product [Tuwongella immobilis]VTR99940.1 unnamed protein product [Tuwongella immobilis]
MPFSLSDGEMELQHPAGFFSQETRWPPKSNHSQIRVSANGSASVAMWFDDCESPEMLIHQAFRLFGHWSRNRFGLHRNHGHGRADGIRGTIRQGRICGRNIDLRLWNSRTRADGFRTETR